jgi:hypothetical protein
MTTQQKTIPNWYASETMAALEALRMQNDYLRRRATGLEVLANTLGRENVQLKAELAQMEFSHEADRIKRLAQAAKQGREADRRRERLGWWEAAAWFALGAWLMGLTVWAKGGIP